MHRTVTAQETANGGGGYETRIDDPWLGIIFSRLVLRSERRDGTTSPACLAAAIAVHETYKGELGASCDESLEMPDAPFVVYPAWNHRCGEVGECARFEGIEYREIGRMLGSLLPPAPGKVTK